MNFLSMQYFSMVAREKSFTKAAAKLYITQQTLSAHIAAIEKELGCPVNYTPCSFGTNIRWADIFKICCRYSKKI